MLGAHNPKLNKITKYLRLTQRAAVAVAVAVAFTVLICVVLNVLWVAG